MTIARDAAVEEIKLTSLSSCAGCAAKLGQTLLREMVKGLPAQDDPRLLVGTDTADDAGVFQIDSKTALVQTVDFFTPIVDDPFDFGRIAATNALSDVYAMGGRPLTAMNIVGVPTDKVPMAVMGRVLKGGAMKVAEAGAVVVGGHTIRTTEPIYGLSVTGRVHPKKVMSNAKAEPGDVLILTKPLGVGIVTTALKRKLKSAGSGLVAKAVRLMTHLNTVGATMAEAGLVKAGTDVTGFGLTGHLMSLCRASEVGAEIDGAALPFLDAEVMDLIEQGCVPGGSKTNLETADGNVDWGTMKPAMRVLMADAQTSGGLLLCVPEKKIGKVLELLRLHKTPAAAVVGRITAARRPRIVVR